MRAAGIDAFGGEVRASTNARCKTFEIYNQPGAPPTEWDAAFAALTED
jgi:hypothetical protein